MAGLRTAFARAAFLNAVKRIQVGTLHVEFPDGSRRAFASNTPEPSATLRVLDDAFYAKVIFGGEIGFGEAYMDGLCASPDIVALVNLAILNRRQVNLNRGIVKLVSRWRDRRRHEARRNTVEKAKENIHAHYDIGNSFYKLWLDETLTYSSAFFKKPDEPLADAQRNKYRMLCERAGIASSDHVLEIGSGWGGFAIFAASTYGCRATTITISKEQLDEARRRVTEAGLDDCVKVEFMDYRDLQGTFDKIVSIEMFEAVGAEYFETFFKTCDRVLKPGGKIAMQVITVPDADFANQVNGVNWIQKYVFPGGVLPSLAALRQAITGTSLTMTDTEDIGLHYAVTLRQWRRRFWDKERELRALGFDDRFMRTWDY
ncbi:MAG: class I SAM-dependent methyltransferase, partial [SAR202 cluster bacterium]|nr:class I SAM-dependent methyltransferase [SAR202 cluster bacterium]